MRVKEVADLAGISVRTLHHYDAIGLLVPQSTTEAGHRLYTQADLERLQHILFFRELGFPLRTIKEIIDSPKFDQKEALIRHREALVAERDRLARLIGTIDKTLQHLEGSKAMSNQERFEGFDFSHNPYEDEARRRWGDEAVDRSNARVAQMSEADQEAVSAIFAKLAMIRDTAPESDQAQEAIGEWYDLLNRNFGEYTPEAFGRLGQMYVDDQRFTRNIDQFGAGLANFMARAMAVFAERRRG